MVTCLDSTIIIDFLKGRKEAVSIIKEYKEKDALATTEINVFEIFLGIYLKEEISNEEILKATELFNALLVLPFDNPSGKEAAQIYASLHKKGKLIEQNDIFIASIMKNNGLSEIITKNKDHFSRIEDIKVISY